MADEIKKTTDEVEENTANASEGPVADNEVETVGGGLTVKTVDLRKDLVKPASNYR